MTHSDPRNESHNRKENSNRNSLGGVGPLLLFLIGLSRWSLDIIFNNELLLNLDQAVPFYQVFFLLNTLNYEQVH